MCKYTIGTPCYIKELPKSKLKVGIISQVKLSSAPLVTSAYLYLQYRYSIENQLSVIDSIAVILYDVRMYTVLLRIH